MSKTVQTITAAPAPTSGRRPPRQFPAFAAMTRAAVVALMRNFSNLFFGFLFPIVFIAIFGLLGNSSTHITLGVVDGSDQASPIYQALSHIGAVQLSAGSRDDLNAKLRKGELDGVLSITPATRTIIPPVTPSPIGTTTPRATATPTPGATGGQAGFPTSVQGYDVTLTTSNASPQNAATAQTFVQGVIDQVNLRGAGVTTPEVQLATQSVEGRAYTYIDFALPGQLGFSLLSIAVFGTAFGFVVLKRTLVLKRIFATPTRPATIVLAQGTARLLVAFLQVLVLLAAGVYLFHFHLADGVTTLVEMVVVSLFGLAAFLGFGLVIAGIFNNENAMGPVINLVTFPQFLLGGTFFPTNDFPTWLQPIANNLPLTYLNDALRKIANEGATLYDVRLQLLGIAIWGVVTYAIAIRTFKWE